MKNIKHSILVLFLMLMGQLTMAQNETELIVNISNNRQPANGKVQLFDGSEMIAEEELVGGSVFFNL